MTEELYLFSDASLFSEIKTGFGAYILIPKDQISQKKVFQLQNEIQIARFDNFDSIVQLELETLLWSLQDTKIQGQLTIFTDSQNISNLPGRRNKLQARAMKSTKTGQLLKNAEQYARFFNLLDQLQFSVVKVKGHMKKTEKGAIDNIFSLVDRAARKALRAYLSKQ